MVTALLLTIALGASGLLADAETAFENGDAARCLALLDRAEASGASPRSASLRAFAHAELDQPLLAHRAAKLYLKLMAGRAPRDADAHRDLVDLEAQLRERVRAELKKKTGEIDEEGDAEAARAEEAALKRAEAEAQRREAEHEARVKVARHARILEDAAAARRARLDRTP